MSQIMKLEEQLMMLGEETSYYEQQTQQRKFNCREEIKEEEANHERYVFNSMGQKLSPNRLSLEVFQNLETAGIQQKYDMEVEEDNSENNKSQEPTSMGKKCTMLRIENKRSANSSQIMRKMEFDIVPKVNFDKNIVFDLFCDVPVHLEYFLRDAGCGSDVAVPVRSCLYNSLKKVEYVESICHGSIIEGKLLSNFQASRDFSYLSSLLKSKGSQKLFDLSKQLDSFQQYVNALTVQIAGQISSKEESFFEKRTAAGRLRKAEILKGLDPRDSSCYKSYEVEYNNGGSLKLIGYGFLRGYCELMGLSIADYKQRIIRNGFMENLDYCSKVRTMLNFFSSNVPWNSKQPMVRTQHPIDCLTFDNIYFTGELRVDTYNLSYDFDKQHKFNCAASDTMLLLTIIVDHETENAIKINRAARHARNMLDDNEDQESDFKYSKESQQFLELYYNNLYGPNYAEKKQLRQCEYVDITQARSPVIIQKQKILLPS